MLHSNDFFFVYLGYYGTRKTTWKRETWFVDLSTHVRKFTNVKNGYEDRRMIYTKIRKKPAGTKRIVGTAMSKKVISLAKKFKYILTVGGWLRGQSKLGFMNRLNTLKNLTFSIKSQSVLIISTDPETLVQYVTYLLEQSFSQGCRKFQVIKGSPKNAPKKPISNSKLTSNSNQRENYKEQQI